MEPSAIRGRPIATLVSLFPDYAEFIIEPAGGRTRWLHPGYKFCKESDWRKHHEELVEPRGRRGCFGRAGHFIRGAGGRNHGLGGYGRDIRRERSRAGL